MCCKEFEDNKGRKIVLKHNNCSSTIEAYYNDSCVGEISFNVTKVGGDYSEERTYANPHTMNIRPEYQRAGIATEIIKFAKDVYDTVSFADDPGAVEDKDYIHYSMEGLAFKNKCEQKGGVLEKQPEEDELY